MIFEKLKTVMDQLPVITVNSKDYTPYFSFGTEDDLKKTLKAYRQNQGAKIYPLIWLVTPIEEQGEMDLEFIIATLNRRTDMGNFDRLTWTFNSTLEPLLTNLQKAIKQSRAFKPIDFDRENRGTKFFDYHLEPETWDAIRYEIPVRYWPHCPVKTKMNF